MGTAIYIGECRPEKGSLLSELAAHFVPTGYTHTVLRVGNVLYEVDLTKGRTYNKFDLTDNCCDYLKKWGYRIDFFKIGEYDDETIRKITAWWDEKLKKQPIFNFLRFITYPIDIPRLKYFEWKYRKTGKPEQTLFDLLAPNSNTCIAAVDKSLKAGGIDLRPDLTENQSYPGLLSEPFRNNKTEFICTGS